MTATVVGEIDRVLHGNRLASSSRRTEHGEWDWLEHVPRRTVRRLIGGGYFGRRGLSMDEAADMICDRVPGVDTLDAAIEWYIRTALAELDERATDRASAVRWEDQERPDDEWPDDEPLEEPADEPAEPITLAPAECPTIAWDVEPAPSFDPDARPTFYGSKRPTRVSCWDSGTDDASRRRQRRHGTTWWRIRSIITRWTLR